MNRYICEHLLKNCPNDDDDVNDGDEDNGDDDNEMMLQTETGFSLVEAAANIVSSWSCFSPNSSSSSS